MLTNKIPVLQDRKQLVPPIILIEQISIMKKTILLCALCALMANAFAQKETFDLVTYTPPANWQKDVKENSISYTIVNKTTKSWCRINIIKSTISKGDIEKDFESEWQELVVKSYKPAEAPQLNEVQEAAGWKIKAGGAKFIFNNSDAMAMLTTASGFERCASIVATTNNRDYIKDIEAFLTSVDLIKPETNVPVAKDDNAQHPSENSIIGTWGKNGSVNPSYNDAYTTSIAGYSKDQYTFNSNGTYHFISKTFGMSYDKILLVKETGTYQISGNSITINPQKAVLEAWSKKDGGDKWGKLLSSQKRTLEKVTYQFTKHYFSGIQEWNFVLQTDKVTQRDGPHSNNTTFTNAWYFKPISSNNPVIELPAGQKITTEEILTEPRGKKEPVQQSAANNEPILGTWGIGTTIASSYNMRITEGSIVTQYTFNANGTYSFYIKTFRYQLDKLLLTRETGTYQLNGNSLTINPQKSVIEAWSKKDGTDNWGKLLSSQKKDLEKTAYRFTKHYSEVLKEWRIVLQANKETKRDGYYNGGNLFNNAWIYSPVTCKDCFIKLPD